MSLAERLVSNDRPDRIVEARTRVQARLVESLGPRLYDSTLSERDLDKLVREKLRDLLEQEQALLSSNERAALISHIVDGVLGYGPLEPLLQDTDVTEIMVNRFDSIYVERGGRLFPSGARFVDDKQLRRTIEKIVARVGRRIDEASPFVDARLPDGSRVNAIIPPLAIDGPC